MSKAGMGMLEQGTQAPSPAPDLIPAETKNQPRTHSGIGTANGGTSVSFTEAPQEVFCHFTRWSSSQACGPDSAETASNPAATCELRMTVSRPRRILSLSRDTRLLITRNDMLAHDGYEVHSPRTPAQAIPLLARGQFDAVVCGHSIQKEHRDRLLCEIRARYPTIPIIFVYDKPNGGDPTTPADVSVNVGEPTNLVQALNELFSHSS